MYPSYLNILASRYVFLCISLFLFIFNWLSLSLFHSLSSLSASLYFSLYFAVSLYLLFYFPSLSVAKIDASQICAVVTCAVVKYIRNKQLLGYAMSCGPSLISPITHRLGEVFMRLVKPFSTLCRLKAGLRINLSQPQFKRVVQLSALIKLEIINS